MRWQQLPVEIQHIAEQHLTQKQLETWKLELAGRTQRQIALHYDISRASVIDRLDGTYRTLRRHHITQDNAGHWHHERPT